MVLPIPMTKMADFPKSRTSGVEAKNLLIHAVIDLAKSIPFPDVTARRIAAEVDMDPNVIFRNFETLENLFLATLRFLEDRTLRYLEVTTPIGFAPIDDLFLWVKLSTWLTLCGVAPERLAVDADLLTIFQTLSLGHLRVSERASGRAQLAAMVLAFSYLQAQVMFTPAQPNLFTPEAMDDAMMLLGTIMERLEELTNQWERD